MRPLVDLQAGPGNQSLLAPSLILGLYVLPTIPTAGAIFRDIVLREQCVAETPWTESS